MQPLATRFVDLEFDTDTRQMSIVYDPENVGGSRTSFSIQPWPGAYEFIVDESRTAGCEVWKIRVNVEFSADSQSDTPGSNVRISYDLEEFDCDRLIKSHAR